MNLVLKCADVQIKTINILHAGIVIHCHDCLKYFIHMEKKLKKKNREFYHYILFFRESVF